MKILISIGREIGGVTSFSMSLGSGFEKLGYEVIYFKPQSFYKYYKELKNPENIKILSTTGVFLAPFFKNTISVAHGFPRIGGQGFIKWGAITLSFYIASKYSKLIAVSHYVKNHIKAIYGIESTGVIFNPLKDKFFEERKEEDRKYITYVGRLHSVKNIDKFFEPLKKIKEKYKDYKIIIIGAGNVDISKFKEIKDFEYVEHMDEADLLKYLSKTKVFFSGCETEALGISFIEALACGANIVMPLSGGGLEIDTELLNKGIFTINPSFDNIFETIEKAIEFNDIKNFDKYRFKEEKIATEYLKVLNG